MWYTSKCPRRTDDAQGDNDHRSKLVFVKNLAKTMLSERVNDTIWTKTSFGYYKGRRLGITRRSSLGLPKAHNYHTDDFLANR
jgi:hypothetical protein